MTQPPPDIEAVKAFNAKVTEEFRASRGKVGAFEGAELTPSERADIIPKVAEISAFAEFQAKTSRVIPIFELNRV